MWFGKVWGVSLHGDVLLLVGGVVASYKGDRFERLGRNKLVKSFSQCPLESGRVSAANTIRVSRGEDARHTVTPQ